MLIETMGSVIAEFSGSILSPVPFPTSSELVSETEAAFVKLGVSPILMASPLPLLSRSASASMDCCFKGLVMVRLALPLLFMVPNGVRLLPVFVGEAGRFPLMFSVGLSVGVGRVGAL